MHIKLLRQLGQRLVFPQCCERHLALNTGEYARRVRPVVFRAIICSWTILVGRANESRF